MEIVKNENNQEPVKETRIQAVRIHLSNGKSADFVGPAITELEGDLTIEKIEFGEPESVTDEIRNEIKEKS